MELEIRYQKGVKMYARAWELPSTNMTPQGNQPSAKIVLQMGENESHNNLWESWTTC